MGRKTLVGLIAVFALAVGVIPASATHESFSYDPPAESGTVTYDPPPVCQDPPAESGTLAGAAVTVNPGQVCIDPPPVQVPYTHDPAPRMVPIPHEEEPPPPTAPNIAGVTDPTAAEGTHAVFRVWFTGPTVASTFRLSHSFVTASAADIGAFQYSVDGQANWLSPDASGNMSIPAGRSDFHIRTLALTDALAEGDERFNISVAPVSNGGTVTGGAFAIITNVAAPPPPPPSGELPFQEAQIRSGYTVLDDVALSAQNVTCPQGNDCLIDLQGVKRTIGSLLIWGYSGQRIKVIDGWWEVTKAIDGSPYWRGGPRVRAADGVGPEHVSLTNILTSGPSIPDAIAVDSGNTKVTIQRWRHESRFVWDGQNSPEPAEHADAFQVQGNIGAVEIGLATVYCQNIASPNEGGKCFQLKNEGGNTGFPVALSQVNMRLGGRTGTSLLQTTRDIPVTLTDVYAKDDGITTGSNWNWSTNSGGLFFPNGGGTIGWQRSGTAGSYIATWPAAAMITGQIREGLPAGGDFVTRAMLGH